MCLFQKCYSKLPMTKLAEIDGRKDKHTISFIKSHTSLLDIMNLGYETTSSVTLRKEHRLRVFENRMVKKYLGLRRQKRLRWSGGLWYQSSRVQTRPKPSNFSGRKNQHNAFLRKVSKAVCPTSHICSM